MKHTSRKSQPVQEDREEVSWFSRDEPVADLTARDAFGHQAHSAALARAALEAEPPFTIGLFGEWGVGKTTVTKEHFGRALLERARLEGQSVAYAYFDVWKYEDDSLRRAFLQELALQLRVQKQLSDYDPKVELSDLVWDVQEPGGERLRFSVRRAIVSLIYGLATAGIAWVAFQLFGPRLGMPEGQRLATALVAGIAVALAKEARTVFVVSEARLSRRSLDSPEMFEEKFSALMNRVKADRLVIVVDNLDRCASDRVLQVLGTIKTFLEPVKAKRKPIFVIPCSDRTIKAQVQHKAGLLDDDADEFLRKFFNAGIRINPILEEEMREYVEAELSGLRLGEQLTDQEREGLLQVVTIAFRANPRRVKQFFNSLVSKLLLIEEREATEIIAPPISGEVAFLAKMTAIEENWNRFYDAVERDPRVLTETTQLAVGTIREATERVAEFTGDLTLLAFLRGTRRIVSDNVRAFMRLKLARMEREIPDYREFRAALLDGRLDDLRQILERDQDGSET